MAAGWAFNGEPGWSARGDGGQVTLVEGTTFCICEASGDIRQPGAQGLFVRDTRFISRFELTLDSEPAEPLVQQGADPFAATFIARRPPLAGQADSTMLVVRNRYVGDGMREDITLRNLSREAAAVRLAIAVDSDFADLFAVKEGRARRAEHVSSAADAGALRMSRRHGTSLRGVRLQATGGASVNRGLLSWQAVVPALGSWSTTVQVVPSIDGQDLPQRYKPTEPIDRTAPARRLADWRQRSPLVTTPDEALAGVFAASTEDLGSLRIYDSEHADRTMIAAGAPWFMTIFGRDSLLTSWMLVPLDASLALGTLQTLARFQGERVNPLTEEQPGRILHEMRFGMDASLSLDGGHVYYGTVDAAPLFVMLLGELRRWGLGSEVVDQLLPHADRALEWITNYGDRDGDGFVEYRRATDRGLVNQGWKDSFDGITFDSGRIAEPPVAAAEVQGYVYAAYRARAHVARERGDAAGTRHWLARAGRLKEAFNRAFWLPERGYFAMGLDAEKRPIDGLASNMGHCLWTGIVDQDKAAAVAAHLTGPDLFSGFGIRTLAASSGAYNPMSYHNGSVWPHDNAICAAGLMRYGFVSEAQQVATAIFDAAERLGGRLPELFCGFDRSDFGSPVGYPTSCAPQAWAAAAPFLLLRTLLRFDPSVPSGRIWCSPAVPARFLPLRVDALRLADGSATVQVTSGDWQVDGLPPGIGLVREARGPRSDFPETALYHFDTAVS